jgi:hypothetical protein
VRLTFTLGLIVRHVANFLTLPRLGRFVVRALATLVLLWSAFASGAYFAVFALLSMPIGASNVPGMLASLLGALVFCVLALVAVVECWRRPPFSAFTSVILAISIAGYAALWISAKQSGIEKTASPAQTQR